MAEFPLATLDRIIRRAGAERVSEDAKEVLADLLEDYGKKIASNAINIANKSGRKTIKAKDIELAVKSI
ncbi:MAG: histone [Candidatus Dadabacteria bacterium]|nr:histone [Candidatus Dadabacteria bacterium]